MDLNSFKLETHMVIQDTTVMDHGVIVVINGQPISKSKLNILASTMKESSGFLLSFSPPTSLA